MYLIETLYLEVILDQKGCTNSVWGSCVLFSRGDLVLHRAVVIQPSKICGQWVRSVSVASSFLYHLVIEVGAGAVTKASLPPFDFA